MSVPETLAIATALLAAIGSLAQWLGGRRQARAQTAATTAEADHTEAEAESVTVSTMAQVVDELRGEMKQRDEAHQTEVRRLNEAWAERLRVIREEHDRVVAAMQETIGRLRDRIEVLERHDKQRGDTNGD